MKLNVQALASELKQGVNVLNEVYQFIDESGVSLIAKQHEEKTLRVEMGDEIVIYYNEKAAFFRGLAHVLQNREVNEVVQFDVNGLMFDCSRNGVLSMDYTKSLIRKLALLGLNTYYLYVEDTYELKEDAYFGHMRGRYSHEELREMDVYAKLFGIEVVPCIQTLAHINQYLRWQHTAPLKDIEDILLVGSEKTYELIEAMIKNLSECLSTSRIHVGMDEAYHLGRGEFLNKFGLQSKTQIMQQHLNVVKEIMTKYEKEMLIWDDMFFSSYGKDSEEKVNLDNITLVYWDYYQPKEEHYHKTLTMRKELAEDVMFAGGAWRWTGFVPPHQFTYDSTNAALTACKKQGIKQVMVTSWGDDGSECPADMVWFGTALFAEHGYNEVVNEEIFKQQLEFVTGLPFEAHLIIDSIDRAKGSHSVSNCSKTVLYQDPLLPLMQAHHTNLEGHFEAVKAKLAPYADHDIAAMYVALLDVLELKWNLSQNLKAAYDQKDKDALASIVTNQIDPLIERVKNFHRVYEAQWHACYKSFGYEVLDIRLAAIVGRLETTKRVLHAYISGQTTLIEQLECDALPYLTEHDGRHITIVQYGHIATPSRLTW